MTSPLLWKSSELCNTYYESVLRYSFNAYLEPTTELFVIRQDRKIVYLNYAYLACMKFFLIFAFDVAYEVFIKGTQRISLPYAFFNIFIIILMSASVILLLAIRPNLPFIGLQYFNSLFKFERHIVCRQPYGVKGVPLKNWCHKGKKHFNIFHLLAG